MQQATIKPPVFVHEISISLSRWESVCQELWENSMKSLWFQLHKIVIVPKTTPCLDLKNTETMAGIQITT